MPPTDKFFDVERRSFAFVQRVEPFIDFGAEPPKLLDVRKQVAADLFLIGLG